MSTADETEQRILDKIQRWTDEQRKQPYLIALDGMCASGKTTLAMHVQEQCPDVEVIHMDDFFLRPEIRTPERLKEPGGNVDYERFRKEVSDPLIATGSCRYRVYSCKCQGFVCSKTVRHPRIVIIEGAYSAHPYFGEIYDAVFFLSISPEEQKERIRKRNGERMLTRFLNEWIPMENRYFETFRIKEKYTDKE